MTFILVKYLLDISIEMNINKLNEAKHCKIENQK